MYNKIKMTIPNMYNKIKIPKMTNRSLTIMVKAINIIRRFCIIKDKYFTLLFFSLIRYVYTAYIDLDIKV